MKLRENIDFLWFRQWVGIVCHVKACVIKILKMDALEQVMRVAEASICPPAGVSNAVLKILLTPHNVFVCIHHFSKRFYFHPSFIFYICVYYLIFFIDFCGIFLYMNYHDTRQYYKNVASMEDIFCLV